jgi:hypothetical protein
MAQRSLTLSALCVILLALPGCGAAGFFATLFPPPKEPAEYEFPKREKVLVLADNVDQYCEHPYVVGYLERDLRDQLRANDAVTTLINETTLQNLRRSSRNLQDLSIEEIARMTGADKVLYVRVDEFRMRDGSLWSGRFRSRIKVVDVTEGRVWPREDPDGKPLEVIDPRMDPTRSHDYADEYAQELSAIMSGKIARLFYEAPGKPHGSLPERRPEDQL